ncbi:MAG: LPS assembly protein LptD [Acidobacteria bacterium]|nr:LPS assembly protein LptD [Acidobacteriota bacterium]
MRLPIPITVLCVFAVTAGAQMTEQGPSARFYETNPDFTFEFPSIEEGGQVVIAADTQSLDDDYMILEGNVSLTYQDVTLSADSISYNRRTRDASARGHVILDQGPRRITASRAIYNFDARSGTLFDATATLGSSVWVAGKTIEKLDDSTYRVVDGVFTSCELGDPSWIFSLDEALIEVEGYARLRDISFRAGGVPIIRLPYIIWPTKRERARGFLIPKPGYSSRFGAYLQNAYFLPFNEWSDVTLRADLYSSGVLATGVQANYVPTANTDGTLDVFTVYDSDTNELEWKYDYRHTQENLPGGFRGVIDIKDYSDLPFFQRFERDFDLNTISNIYSAAYLTRNTPTWSLNIRADRREHFLGLSDVQIFEQLPALQLRLYPKRVPGTPLYFSLDSSASHLRTSGSVTRSAEYFRTDLFPKLSLQLSTPSWISVNPEISFRQTDYTKSQDPLTGSIVDESLSRSSGQASIDVTGPSFSKVFDMTIGEFTRFKHIIEPRVRYRYITDVEGQDRVIRFDTVDSLALPLVSQTIEYSLTQRLLAKSDEGGGSAREVLSFAIEQSQAISEPFRISDGEEQFFSPLRASLRFNPYRSVRVEATAAMSNQNDYVERANVSAYLSGAKSYLQTTLFSTFSRPGSILEDSSQIRIATGSPLWGEKLRGDVQINWDITEGTLLEQRYLLGYTASCYTFAFEYRDFQEFSTVLTPVPSLDVRRTRDYQISISLKNVGTFVDFRGSFDRTF